MSTLTHIADKRDLAEAIDPFRRVLSILDSLPPAYKHDECGGVGPMLPLVWPTLAELRELVRAATVMSNQP